MNNKTQRLFLYYFSAWFSAWFSLAFAVSSIAAESEPLPLEEPQTLSWELKRDKDGIKVFTTTLEDSKYKAVRATTRIKARLGSVVGLVRDTTACPEISKLCKESWVQEDLSETELLVYSYNDMPWPVKDRDILVRAVWSQDPETLAVTMHAHAEPGVIPPNKKAVRLGQAAVSWTFVPVKDGQIDVSTYAHIDPEGPMPAWITNLLLIDSPYETLTNLRSLLASGRYDDVSFNFIRERDE